MKAPSSSREVLMAEAIGELGNMLDKVEALLPAISDLTRQQLDANTQWVNQLSSLDSQVHALTEKVKLYAVKHLLTQLEEHAARTMQTQTTAMCEAVSIRFTAELELALQQVGQAVHQRQVHGERGLGRQVAMTGFLGAAVAGAMAGALLTWLWAR